MVNHSAYGFYIETPLFAGFIQPRPVSETIYMHVCALSCFILPPSLIPSPFPFIFYFNILLCPNGLRYALCHGVNLSNIMSYPFPAETAPQPRWLIEQRDRCPSEAQQSANADAGRKPISVWTTCFGFPFYVFCPACGGQRPCPCLTDGRMMIKPNLFYGVVPADDASMRFFFFWFFRERRGKNGVVCVKPQLSETDSNRFRDAPALPLARHPANLNPCIAKVFSASIDICY